MNIRNSLPTLSPLVVLALLLTCGPVYAQGTAGGPISAHVVTGGPNIFVGDPTNPFPIDLDPNGQPWFKTVSDGNGAITQPTVIPMTEYVLNIGNEPWFDWHEHILPPLAGQPQSTWQAVNGLFINGNPIAFNALGVGTPNLWLDTFSQPVLPGDILRIEKLVEVFPDATGIGGPLLRIEEYPTPEPASAALISLGSLMLMARRKSEST